MNTPSDGLGALRDAILAMPMAQSLQLDFVALEPGRVEVEMPVQPAWCFRPGQLQAAALFALGDFAAVAAVSSLLPPGSHAATLDAQVKLLAPGRGRKVLARGRALHLGGTIGVGAADVYAVGDDGRETLVATLLASARRLDARPG